MTQDPRTGPAERRPDRPRRTGERVRREIPGMGMEELSEAVSGLARELRCMGVPEQAVQGVELALEELGANAILHGGADAGSVEVRIERGAAVGVLADNGGPFDAAAAAQDASPPADPAEGGHGLLMVRAFCSSVRSSREGGGNLTQVRVPLPRGLRAADGDGAPAAAEEGKGAGAPCPVRRRAAGKTNRARRAKQ